MTAVVQYKPLTQFDYTDGTSCALTFDSAVTPGNWVLFAVGGSAQAAATGVTAVSDNKTGNIYALIAEEPATGPSVYSQLYGAYIVDGGSTFTVTGTKPFADYCWCAIIEVSGLASSDILDGLAAVGTGADGSTDPEAGPTGVPSTAGFAIAISACDGLGVANVNYSAPSGYTSLGVNQDATAGVVGMVAVKPLETAAAQTVSFGNINNGAGKWSVLVAVLKAAAPSPATISDPTPSGTLGTETTAPIGCTTDQIAGTLYVVVDSAANMAGITDAQIIAGTNANDAAPVFDGSGAISTTSPSVGATDLVANTAYAYAIVQVNDNGESNVVSGTFTTAEEAAQEAIGDGDFAVALSTAQAGTGQAAARKLRLTEANELELRSETGALITASGVNFEWYDKHGNTTGEPDVTGSFDVVDGEAVVPLFGSVLDEGQPGTLILYHPALNTVNGLYRLLVE